MSVADERSEDESGSSTIRVKPKTLPPTPNEKEAFVAVKKSLFKGVVEPVGQSVTTTEDRLTEVATRVKGVAPSVPPVRRSHHESTEAQSFTDRFRRLGVALEDFVPRNRLQNIASLAGVASKAASKAARNVIQEASKEDPEEEKPEEKTEENPPPTSTPTTKNDDDF